MPTTPSAVARARHRLTASRRAVPRAVRRVEAAAIAVTKRLPRPLRQLVLRAVRRARSLRGTEAAGGRRRGLGRSLGLQPARHGPVADPAVTIVVTSFNRSELLPIALRSVQAQDLAHWECIVVDNGSTDDALLVAQTFAAADERFRIVSHGRQLGPSAARNAGIALATAPLICFLDDDDFLLDGSLRARLDVMGDQPVDVAGVFCDWINTDPHVGLEAFWPHRSAARRGDVSFASLAAGVPFILSAPLLRVDVLRSVGGFDETFDRAEDAELWFRLARLGFRFVDAEHIGIAYRRSVGSLVTGAPEAQLRGLAEVFARADQPDPTVVGHGPLPSPEPLANTITSARRRGAVLRYVALIAASDPDEAVRLGSEVLSPQIRRTLAPDVEAAGLAAGAAARLGLDEGAAERLPLTVADVLRRLATPLEPTWEPTVDVAGWCSGMSRRAEAIVARPDTRPAGDVDGAVVLIPEARYHVDELGPLGRALEARGVEVRYMVSEKTVPAAVAELGRYTDHVLAYAPELVRRARALVTLNDWGPLKALVLDADQHGVATFAKVEGVQDFDDVESSWERNPYRSAAFILAQGDNDVAALPEKQTFVVGSSRLERIWQAPPVEPGARALINLNFTFHVLTERRDEWLESVRDALDTAGMTGLVSKHPAERGNVFDLEVASKPFRHEITKAGVLVSRFSTVPFEAMARGVPFVYHNPHGERFPTFAEPLDGFAITRSCDELAAALTTTLDWRADYRRRSEAFFRRQVDIDERRTSAERAAEVIIANSRARA